MISSKPVSGPDEETKGLTDYFRIADHTGVGSEPATIGLGKAAQLLVYWGALGKGNEACPNTYRQPDGVRT